MGLEIRLQGTAIPCIAQENIQAGRAVKIVAATNAPRIQAGEADVDPRFQNSIYNILQGAQYPDSDNDADANYVAAFRVYLEPTPIYETLPTLDIGGSTIPYTLREWIEGSENLPATNITLRMVAPRLKEDATILSGAMMLVYDEGIYTVTSGCFEAGSYAIGDAISVKADGIWYKSAVGKVGTVLEQNTLKNTLTIKTK